MEPVHGFTQASYYPKNSMEQQEEIPVVHQQTECRNDRPKRAKDYGITPNKRTNEKKWLGKAKGIFLVSYLVDCRAKNAQAEQGKQENEGLLEWGHTAATITHSDVLYSKQTKTQRSPPMAKYVDGFVLVVPEGQSEAYKKMAEEGRESWLKHGALSYFECKGHDLETQEMGGEKAKSFVELAQAKPGEEVWLSFIIFESKEHRDEVNAKVHAEMSESYADYQDFVMPFDMNRMATGGFSVEVEG